MKLDKLKRFAKAKYIIPVVLLLLVITAIAGYKYFFGIFSLSQQTEIVYIDADDNLDSLCVKLEKVGKPHTLYAFKTIANHTGFKDKIRTGRYEIKPEETTLDVFRKLRNGQQTAISVTIPSVRTNERLAAEITKKLMIDSASVANALSDQSVCQKFGYDTTTIACMFIPNTYQLYWDTSVEKLLEKMNTESKRFWNNERTTKAQALELTPVEVITLASIIDEETANNGEKPMIAGMYYNRLKINMPLQADPTVKFALGDFAAKRIYNDMLTVDSPYNTYKYAGLPPGPIRIPSVAGIDAVLNLVHHDYLYMCAKEDFSGTHNFAVTYNQHLQNARKYQNALNNRGIK